MATLFKSLPFIRPGHNAKVCVQRPDAREGRVRFYPRPARSKYPGTQGWRRPGYYWHHAGWCIFFFFEAKIHYNQVFVRLTLIKRPTDH